MCSSSGRFPQSSLSTMKTSVKIARDNLCASNKSFPFGFLLRYAALHSSSFFLQKAKKFVFFFTYTLKIRLGSEPLWSHDIFKLPYVTRTSEERRGNEREIIWKKISTYESQGHALLWWARHGRCLNLLGRCYRRLRKCTLPHNHSVNRLLL